MKILMGYWWLRHDKCAINNARWKLENWKIRFDVLINKSIDIIFVCRENHLLAIFTRRAHHRTNWEPSICRQNFLSEKEKIIFAIETTAAIMQALCRSIKDRKICGPAEISCLRARTCFVRDIRTSEAAFRHRLSGKCNSLVQGIQFTFVRWLDGSQLTLLNSVAIFMLVEIWQMLSLYIYDFSNRVRGGAPRHCKRVHTKNVQIKL